MQHRPIDGTKLVLVLAVACASVLSACGQGRVSTPTPAEPTPAGGLAGTSWQLVEFRSSDDTIGIVRPDDPTRYTMTLEDGGRVSMQLNCNRGSGTWKSAASDGDSGTFTFGPLAVTRAFCPPPSMDDRISRDADFVRTYLLRDGRLYLDLMADAGQYVWAPRATPRP
jgi:heat shock protein HslJ